MALKLLDYGQPDPFGKTIGKTRYLAWPVYAYRVTLPRVSDTEDRLNPFERVVLKLLEVVGTMDAKALADETCIPVDLVNSILLRLQDKGLIDEHYTIIRKEADNSVKEQEPLYVTALLFRELATGRVLPFLHLLEEKKPLRKREEKKGEHMREIRWDDSHKKSQPQQRDVISALRKMKKRSIALSRDDKMPVVQQITIAPQPERYDLYCPIAIQQSDGEFRIADPFGTGFSLALERAFEQILEYDDKLAGWLQNWKQSLKRDSPASAQQTTRQQPYENSTNRHRYPKLLDSLRADKKAVFRNMSKIYASIEWALFYVCCQRQFDDVITRLKFEGQPKHTGLLGDAAERIGLEAPKFGFKPVLDGRLLDFQNAKAELGTVLAIALLQAEKDLQHPLHRIASVYPDFIGRLFEIKKERDKKGHGAGKADAAETELAHDPFMREIIHMLLPEIIFADTPVSPEDKEAQGDSLLDARASIQGDFGFKVFNRLAPNLQDYLIQAERFWLSCQDNDDALVFVCDLYAALQASFRYKLLGKLAPDMMDSDFISQAKKKVQESGWSDLPAALSRVKPLAIRQALQGNDPTLGACVVAFLLISDNETLNAVADSHSSFIDDVANVISRRGHGNEPLPLPKLDIEKLRKASYKTIKTLIEV